MKKNGFIATSLIYSFFLVFVAILAALLNNLIANKTILSRFNEEAMAGLNSKEYTVSFMVYDADVSTASNNGQTLTNIVTNGTFASDESWQSEGELTVQYDQAKDEKKSVQLQNVKENAYIRQEVSLIANHVYYLSSEYLVHYHNSSKNFSLGDQVIFKTDTTSTWGEWTRGSGLYTAMNTEDVPLRIGQGNIEYSEAYFTNVMLIDLTENFGSGNEPSIEWLDENIAYFEGTVQYLKEENVRHDGLDVTFLSRTSDDSLLNVNCTGVHGNWIEGATSKTITYSQISGKRFGSLTLQDINDDLYCTARWS